MAGEAGEDIKMSDAWYPEAPRTLEDAGLSTGLIEQLVLKALYELNGATGSALGRHLGLPAQPLRDVLAGLRQRKLVANRDKAMVTGDFLQMLSVEGRVLAQSHRTQNTWSATAPVPFEEWQEALSAQSMRWLDLDRARLTKALDVLDLPGRVVRRLGMALSSGHALFLYGAPGNGKTTIAESITDAFGGHVFVPHAVEVRGQIIRVFDPLVHEPLPEEELPTGLPRLDPRWVCCRRPTVVAGGELRMESLELQVHQDTGICEAPLQLKAAGGVLLIDDFGRQHEVSPTALLNRWIVPLERHVDYLSLPGGAKIRVPFEAFVVFSTNLDPSKLADEAFLRRIPYKIEIGDPSEDVFRNLLATEAFLLELDLPEASIDHLINVHYQDRPFRGCHPRDLLHQVRDRQVFLHQPMVVSAEAFDEVASNYFIGALL